MSWSDSDNVQGRYLTAEVCENGHPTTGAIEQAPERSIKFCDQCGAKTIQACPSCNAPIRGSYLIMDGIYLADAPYFRPNHCHNCGAGFPWTTAKVEAAKEYVTDIEGLDDTEKAQLQGAIVDLAAGGARTELAANRFKKLVAKAGQKVGGSLYGIVVDVLSEAAKKAITGF